jgi:hypothetical protein
MEKKILQDTRKCQEKGSDGKGSCKKQAKNKSVAAEQDQLSMARTEYFLQECVWSQNTFKQEAKKQPEAWAPGSSNIRNQIEGMSRRGSRQKEAARRKKRKFLRSKCHTRLSPSRSQEKLQQGNHSQQ